jgi:hypothetical protein
LLEARKVNRPAETGAVPVRQADKATAVQRGGEEIAMDESKAPETKITAFACGVKCDHVFDGPMAEFEDGLGGTSTCSKCGAWAIDVCLMECYY